MAKASVNPFKFQYAAKFICTVNIPNTSQADPAFLPGAYQTIVNLHNPGQTTNRYRMKIAHPGGISGWISGSLKYDEVARVACPDIDKFHLPLIHGFEGFLVIESALQLDVSAVYLAGPVGGPVSSIDVEPVGERKI